MQWSEDIYFLISELITMSDRDLAKRIELAIFPKGPEPDEDRLNDFVKMLQESEDGSDFYRWSREYLERLPELFLKKKDGHLKPNPVLKDL